MQPKPVELPQLPTPRELQQRRAQAYAHAVLTTKAARHFAVIGPAAVVYVTSRYSRTVRYDDNTARRMGVVERLMLAFRAAS